MGAFANLLDGSDSSSADTGAFANVLSGSESPAPSFGTPPSTDFGSFASGALDILKTVGGAAAGAFGNSLAAKFQDPSASAAAAKQVQQVQQQQSTNTLMIVGIGVAALVLVLLLERSKD